MPPHLMTGTTVRTHEMGAKIEMTGAGGSSLPLLFQDSVQDSGKNCRTNEIGHQPVDAQRREDLSPADAIFQACLLRFRPITMTTMAALLGGLPLAFGTGAGSELRRPLDIMIVGGSSGQPAVDVVHNARRLSLYGPSPFKEVRRPRSWSFEPRVEESPA